MNGRCVKKGDRLEKAPNNNINININLNVKQKTNCFVGRKIDNYVEVHKNKGEKLEVQRPNGSEEVLKQRKRLLELKNDQESKKKKVNKFQQLTPQKIQRFKETRQKSHKLLDYKRKSGKSVQVLKAQKQISSASKSMSKSKSKSDQNSRKKILRKKRKDSKTLLNFQNSGIKKKIQDYSGKQSQKNSRKSHSYKFADEDIRDIKAYINQKKAKQKKEKDLSLKTEKIKAEKVKQELKKVQAERKVNASLKLVPKYAQKRKSASTKRLPLFHLDDENFDEQQQYNRLQKQAQQLIHLQQDRQKRKKEKQKQKQIKFTPKKNSKIIQKYFKNMANEKQLQLLNQNALIIQKNWRGYRVRFLYANELNLMNHKIQMQKNKIKLKDTKFWNTQSNSSILKVFNQQLNNLHQQKQLNHNNQRSISISSSQQHIQKQKQQEKHINFQVQELKRTLQEQNQKYRQLQQQNKKLKLNLNIDLSLLDKKNIQIEEKQKQQVMVQKIQIIKQQQNIRQKVSQQQLKSQSKNLVFQKRQLAINTQNIDQLKKIVQAYQCSPRQSISASRIKDPNIVQLFQKKQLKLQTKFNKKNQMFERMLKDHLVSPKTYNSKVVLLQQSFLKEKQQIKKRLQQAKRVAQYIQNLQQQQLKESNQKDNKEQQSSENQHPNNKWIDDLSQIDEEQSQNKKNTNINHIKVPEIQQIKQQIEEHIQKPINIFKTVNVDQNLQSSQSQSIQQSQQLGQSKGFQTNLTWIKQYCIRLCEYMRSYTHHRQSFRLILSTPISYDKFQFLKSYRTTLNHENTTVYNCHLKDYLYPFFKNITPKDQAISRQVFEQFNRSCDKLSRRSDMKMIEQYYLECLFDAFNEALDYQRPCSIFGQPMTWIYNSKYLKNYQNIKYQNSLDDQFEQHTIDQFCGVAIARIIQWGSCLCGFIPQALEVDPSQAIQFSEEQVQHVRQNRMALMLEKAIVQQEPIMIDSELQRIEVILCASQLMVQAILIQALTDISQVFN